ncbi:hypothetical protein Pyn_34928 [Prunus yedoensis var. nudiflora]|uniref:Uncharacterized protein n=1 Tax=Prunus yedoensis var. nudiflora TaxID=2094558 RepID=A0A314YBT7_PRUYE|nr:hypothetical protein Pyn_34928 [Prunus yedoensis var. nudiflora]
MSIDNTEETAGVEKFVVVQTKMVCGGGDRVQRAELEDTATSPSKSSYRLSVVADSIRRQHEREQRNRRLRDEAWEARLFMRCGDSRERNHSHDSVFYTVSSSTRHGDNRVFSTGEGHMQNVGAVGFGLDLNVVVKEQVPTVEGELAKGIDVSMLVLISGCQKHLVMYDDVCLSRKN